ncbi:MAG: hypothetical protein AB7R89_08835 [Dehalococcoidia bacterium]
MDAEQFQSLRSRWEEATRDVLSAIEFLSTPSDRMQAGDLTAEQLSELYRDFHMRLAEIQDALAALRLTRVSVEIESRHFDVEGLLPRWFLQGVGPITPPVRLRGAGVITPPARRAGDRGSFAPLDVDDD